MVYESMSKKELVNYCREKERNLQKKDDEILELRQSKDEAFQNLLHSKDEISRLLQQNAKDLRKKQDDLDEKDQIISEREVSIEQYKKLTSEGEINHFMNIIHEYKRSESKVFNNAKSSITDYKTFFIYCFGINTLDSKVLFQGKILLWKLGDWVLQRPDDLPTVIRFLSKLPVRYISKKYDGPGPNFSKLQSRNLFFDFKKLQREDWMDNINKKIEDKDKETNESILLSSLLTIHTSPHDVINEAGNVCEAISSQIFFGTLFNEINHFLSRVNGDVELKISQEKPVNTGETSNSSTPDGVLYIKKRACVVVEIKRIPIFRGGFNNDVLDMSKKEITQLTNYMIDCGCSRGILSDSFRYILIEMDPSVKEQNGTNKMTLRYKDVNAHDMQPSLLEVLLGFIQESIEDEESGIEMMKLMNKYPINTEATHSQEEPVPKKPKTADNAFTRLLEQMKGGVGRGSKQSDQDDFSSRPPSAQNEQDVFIDNHSTENTESITKREKTRISIEYKQEDLLVYYSEAYTRVIRCQAKQFGSILESNIDPKEIIVAKIYLDTKEKALELYEVERECIRRLSKDTEYHNCYLKHSEGYVVAKERHGRHSNYTGYVILSRFIGANGWEVNGMSRIELEKQLEVIHRNGIAHNDIKKDNFLYDEVEDKAYIMDFSLSILMDRENRAIYEDTIRHDKAMLRIIFEVEN